MKETIKIRIKKRLQRGGDITSLLASREIFKVSSLYLIVQTKDWQSLCVSFTLSSPEPRLQDFIYSDFIWRILDKICLFKIFRRKEFSIWRLFLLYKVIFLIA